MHTCTSIHGTAVLPIRYVPVHGKQYLYSRIGTETPSSVNKGDPQLTPWTEPGETPSSVDKGGTSDRTGGDPEPGRQGRPTATSDRTGGDPEPGRQGRPTAESDTSD
eukprot:SAG11_NODE_289_length_11184_cov_20.648083_1_plen_107_part_00